MITWSGIDRWGRLWFGRNAGFGMVTGMRQKLLPRNVVGSGPRLVTGQEHEQRFVDFYRHLGVAVSVLQAAQSAWLSKAWPPAVAFEHDPYARVHDPIERLRARAAEAGDTAQVRLCDLALAGDDEARLECMGVIYQSDAWSLGHGGRCRCGAALPAVPPEATPPQFCSEECAYEEEVEGEDAQIAEDARHEIGVRYPEINHEHDGTFLTDTETGRTWSVHGGALGWSFEPL